MSCNKTLFEAFSTMAGDSDSVSPVTLSSDWSLMARLLLLSSLAVIGSVGNVFMISAVMIEDYLKKRGNAFLVNIALADLLITGTVIPACIIVILANLQDAISNVCYFQWFMAILCCFVSILTSTATAIENYIRLCHQESYVYLTPTRITITLLCIWLVSGSVVTIQFVFNLGTDYCKREFNGSIPYHISIGCVLVLLPVVTTLTCYIKIICNVRDAMSRPSFKPSAAFICDYELLKSNLTSFIAFIALWLPFGIIFGIGTRQHVPSKLFYNFSWLALSKSCINNFIYCITNRHFREAYISLFHYCCCKTSVSFSRRQRAMTNRPTADVRVHIIPGYNMYYHTRPSCKFANRPIDKSAPREGDIYEL